MTGPLSGAGTIDVHAHCVPDDVIATLRADDGRFGVEISEEGGRYVATIAGRVQTRPMFPALSDLPRRLAAMDTAGIAVQVLSSWIDLTAYALEPAAGARYARMFNEALAATVGAAPDRFVTLATVPLQTPDAAAAELRHAVGTLGHVGVEIATTVDGLELDDPGLEPFWAAAEELRCLVVVHPYASLAGRGVQRYNLGNLVGNPAESTIALGHLIFGGVLERHPGLQLCVVHGGGFAPYQIGRWDRGYRTNAEGAAANLTRSPSEWLRTIFFDTVLHSAPSLRHLIDTVGVGQVLLGSDYPFMMGDPEPLTVVDAVEGLSADDRERIVRGNLAAVLEGVRQ